MSKPYSVQPLEAQVPVKEYLTACVDVDKFLGFCRECRNYGRRWSCPPFAFDPMELWGRFAVLHLFARVLVPAPGAGIPVLMEGMKREKGRLMEELYAMEQVRPGSMLLSAGSCTLCNGDCTRLCAQSCRKPDKLRYSIEALGGDVAETAKNYLQKPLLWIKNGKAPDYLTLVGGLLLREGA